MSKLKIKDRHNKPEKLKGNIILKDQLSPATDNSFTPLFCFNLISKLVTDEKLRLVKEDDLYSKELLGKINTLSQMTWGEIMSKDRKTNGYENISLDQIKGNDWLKRLLKEYDKNKIDVFRVKSRTKSRLLGFREGRVFKVCCYDNNGVLYSHD